MDKHHSVISYLVKRILAVFVLVSVLFTLFHVWAIYQHQITLHASRMDAVAQELEGYPLADSARNPVRWQEALDRHALDAALLLSPDRSQPLLQIGVFPDQPFSRQYRWQKEGNSYLLTLYQSPRVLYAEVWHQTQWLMASTLIQLLVIWGSIRFFSLTLFDRALRSFLRRVDAVTLSELKPLEPSEPCLKFPEFRKVIDSMNKMIFSLADSREQLADLNQNLEQKVREKTIKLQEQNRELVALNQRLSVLANTDALTQVYNRSRFDQLFKEHVESSHRRSTSLSLLMIDLDDFKKVNDTYGHQTGDKVLKHAAVSLADCLDDQDIIARWGGEEFIVLLPYAGLKEALDTAEMLRLCLEQRDFEDERIRVTASIGVAELAENETCVQLLKRADFALYHSKDKGRNRISVAPDLVSAEPEVVTPVTAPSLD